MTVLIGYIGATSPQNDGLNGALQAISDNNTTGKFVSQRFELKDVRVPAGGDVKDSLRGLIKSGPRFILADLPAESLLAAADLPEAKDVTFFNIQATDDALRGNQCRSNILHTMPSRAMLADGLIEYLVLKRWQNIFLVTGPSDNDHAYAAAIKHAITKFQARLVAEKAWTYPPGSKRSDSGHYSSATQVAEFTQGVHYDMLIVADEEGQFGDTLAYATIEARPVAGTQGLTPATWSPLHEEWGATQLQNRFLHRFQRGMNERDYAGWLAVRAIGEAATRAGATDPGKIATYLHSDQFELPGYKGEPLSFRRWDGQMRQAILLADAKQVVTVSPQPGFLHPSSGLDTLGMDLPETQCHATQ